MASHHDAADHAHERSPLLADDNAQAQYTAPDDNASLKSQEEVDTYRYFRWALAYVFAAGIITIFVVGFVNADDFHFDLAGALKRALGGGLSGAAAMVLQVLLLMPIRTIMNYQYRHGSSFTVATKTLHEDGGLRRYYQGIGPACT